MQPALNFSERRIFSWDPSILFSSSQEPFCGTIRSTWIPDSHLLACNTVETPRHTSDSCVRVLRRTTWNPGSTRWKASRASVGKFRGLCGDLGPGSLVAKTRIRVGDIDMDTVASESCLRSRVRVVQARCCPRGNPLPRSNQHCRERESAALGCPELETTSTLPP